MIGLVAMSDPGHYIKFNEKKYLYLFNLDMYQSIKCCAIEHQQIHHQITTGTFELSPCATCTDKVVQRNTNYHQFHKMLLNSKVIKRFFVSNAAAGVNSGACQSLTPIRLHS